MKRGKHQSAKSQQRWLSVTVRSTPKPKPKPAPKPALSAIQQEIVDMRRRLGLPMPPAYVGRK